MLETKIEFRLQDILKHPFENVHLVHTDVDFVPPTIVELSDRTLIEAGKVEWADVLNARVLRVYDGLFGLQIECTDVRPSRLKDFALMLAGYCSKSDHDRWVSPEGRN